METIKKLMAVFTLTDLAIAMATNAHGTAAVLINVSISNVKAVSGGALWMPKQKKNH